MAARSLLVVVRGMILAHSFPVTKILVPVAINQDLKALSPTVGLEVDFLAWVLRGTLNETLQRVDEAGHGTKVLRIDAWTSMAIPIPPVAEQLEIVSSIVAKLARLDALSSDGEQTIGLLKERREALVLAAVSGEIDVRQVDREQIA